MIVESEAASDTTGKEKEIRDLMKETEGKMFRSVKRKEIIKEATKIEKKKRKKRWWLKKGDTYRGIEGQECY